EVAAVDLTHGCVLGRATFGDSDVVPRVSGGQPFVIERTNGFLSVLDGSGNVLRRIDLQPVDGGMEFLNPHDVVYAKPASGPAKAYVSLYTKGGIAVVNPTGHVTNFIDLSTFKATSDTDGSADPDVGFYDPQTERVYFALQRTDVKSAAAPDYIVHCGTVPSV